MNQMMENKQALFCPLEQNIQKLGTILSITPKFDVNVAKNYLSENEMQQLQRLVSAYLDIAEDMAIRQIPMTMEDWENRLNKFIEATDREILQNAGKVTAEIAKAHAESEFEKYRIIQDQNFISDFDKEMLKLIDKNNQDE
jgi:hypothetical protein